MKIIIISWDNLGYISLIEKEIIAQGHEVNHIKMNELQYIYPSFGHKILNAFTKTLFDYNLKREILAKRINKKLLELPNYDLILVVSADWLPVKFISSLKRKTSKLIGWFYDAAANYPRIPNMISSFDKAYTFEKADADKFNIEFLPNFNPYNTPLSKNEFKHYIFHISSERKNRENLLTQIAKQLNEYAIPYDIRLISNNKTDNQWIQISNRKIPLSMVYQMLQKATIQIDIQRERQKGLSFRVFESIGLGQKLITTNEDIKNYDFYDPNNILIINPENIQIPREFLETDYKPLSKEVYEKYTLRNWVKKILSTNP